MDLLFHIVSSLRVNGYRGVPIHNITRDEVQDFTQAELLVDLRYTAALPKLLPTMLIGSYTSLVPA